MLLNFYLLVIVHLPCSQGGECDLGLQIAKDVQRPALSLLSYKARSKTAYVVESDAGVALLEG